MQYVLREIEADGHGSIIPHVEVFEHPQFVNEDIDESPTPVARLVDNEGVLEFFEAAQDIESDEPSLVVRRTSDGLLRDAATLLSKRYGIGTNYFVPREVLMSI